MGTAKIQGELWGAKARDWAELQEPSWRPVYEAVHARTGITSGTDVLDVGCGAGAALVAARDRGANVSGLDAAETLVAIARERLPGARIAVGEMEALPFADAAFDVVTGFNAFQFAADIRRALGEARRVCRRGGTVAMLVWGPKDECDLARATLPAVFALLPPASAAAPAAPPLSQPGVIEAHLEAAGLRPTASGDVECHFTYPDTATAWRAISSAGAVVRAIRHAGEPAVRNAVIDTLGPFTLPNGSVLQRNRFHWVMATPAAAA
ncbi:MAG: class I SAM-dependent methyltransferase [Betaproteobacteria bacterium]|nr:MAG: class I SAM-dependent methyltransferase [Betaproteobacteria bacterium]